MGPKRNAPSGATQGGIASSPAPSSTASSAARPSASSSSSSSPRTHPTTSSSSSTSFANLQTTVQNLLRTYDKRTPGRVKMIDAFMVYLMVQGLLQFTYCVVGGGYVRLLPVFSALRCAVLRCAVLGGLVRACSIATCREDAMERERERERETRLADSDLLQPFNAFLSGFAATVGQFVLTGTVCSRILHHSQTSYPACMPSRSRPRGGDSG